MLLVNGNENDALFVMKLLQQIEQDSGTDVYLLFTASFHDSSSFVRAIVERVESEWKMACSALLEDGRSAYPPPPASLYDEALPAADRLARAIRYVRSLLPESGRHRLVWAMLPLEISNGQAYHELLSALVPWRRVEPWMRGVRLVVRHAIDRSPLGGRLSQAPRTRALDAQLGPKAIEAAIQRETEDATVPNEQRIQNLVMLAALDSANGRSRDAIQKFNHALGHYQATQNFTMQALCINGIGDTFRHQMRDLEQAQHWYECATTPAIESKMPVMIAAVTKNLAEVAFAKSHYGEAEQYFEGLDKLASHMLDPQTKADALEWRGLSQEKQGHYERALESWKAAATVSKSTHLLESKEKNLRHLERVAAFVGQGGEVARFRRQLDAADLERREP